MRGLNLDHLHAFVEVMERGSFSAAGQRFNLTQPAISLQIQQLERRLGVRLIERVGRRAVPTTAGQTLLTHIRQIDAAVAGAMNALQSHRQGVVGRVKLGTGATACIHLLPPLLRRLRHKHPQLEIVVSTGNTPDILKALEDNALDVALVTLPAPGRMFEVTPVLDDELVAIFPTGTHVAASITPAALAERPIVAYGPGGNDRRIIDAWFMRAGMSLKPIMELGSVEAIKKLVAAGLGCAVLPRLGVGGSGRQEGLIVRPLSPRRHRKLAVVLRRDKSLDRPLRQVVNELTKLRR